ncbi:MAG: YciI family protein [Verrucomicrobiaceae bacterium]|nr:YciI family protein [Verrucomicrobiaceae bacterium]
MTEESNTFLYIFRGGADSRTMSPEQMQKNMDAWFGWIKELRSKGHFEGGEPLADGGKVLRGRNGESVTDGPYAEGKEEVGGYLIVTARDLEEAAELARGCPIFANEGTVEVRPIQKIVEP